MAGPILPISGVSLPQAIRPAGQTGGGGFQDVLCSAIQKVEGVGQNASASVERFLAGEGEELHTTILATQQAELSLRSVPAGAQQSGQRLSGNHANADVGAHVFAVSLPIYCLERLRPFEVMNKILANLSTRQRITILVVAIAVGAGLYSLVQWKKEADFRPLFTGPDSGRRRRYRAEAEGVRRRIPAAGGRRLGAGALGPPGRAAAHHGRHRSAQERPHRLRAVRQGQPRRHRIHRTRELPARARGRIGAHRDVAGRGRDRRAST